MTWCTLSASISPDHGHFHDLQQAMAPQVVELYGGALNTVSGNGKALAGVVSQLVGGFDDWIARLDLFESHQAHDAGLVKAGRTCSSR